MCYTFVTVFAAAMAECHNTYQYVNVISASIDNYSLIIVKFLLSNFAPNFQKRNFGFLKM